MQTLREGVVGSSVAVTCTQQWNIVLDAFNHIGIQRLTHALKGFRSSVSVCASLQKIKKMLSVGGAQQEKNLSHFFFLVEKTQTLEILGS